MKHIDYIFKKMGKPSEIRKGWKNYSCPYHGGDGAHFGINTDRSRFYCFVCQESGKLYKLYKDIKNGVISPILNSNSSNVLWADAGHKVLKVSKYYDYNDSPDINHWFKSNYTHITDFEDCILKKDGIKYLNKRGVNPNIIDVGFLKNYSGRLIFPFRKGKEIVYYQGRSFYDIPLKTINPSQDKGWLTKSEVLYNYNFLYGKNIAITEGVFDCLSVIKHTGMMSTCLLGKNVSNIQISMLQKLSVKSVIVFLDKDAIIEAIKLGIKLYNNRFNVKVVIWQDIESKLDPNELGPSMLNKLITNAKTIDYHSETQLLFEYS